MEKVLSHPSIIELYIESNVTEKTMNLEILYLIAKESQIKIMQRERRVC